MDDSRKVDISNSKTIKNFLDQLFKDKLEVRIWQKIEETKEYTFGRIIDYKHHEEKIKLAVQGESIQFDKNRDLYFHTSFKETIFKTKIIKIDKKVITIKRPTLVKIREGRSEDRKNYGSASYHFAEIILPDGEENKVQVLDSSPSGMAIMVKRLVFSNIFAGQKLKIKNSSIESHIGCTAIVRSISPIDRVLSQEVNFRVGLELV